MVRADASVELLLNLRQCVREAKSGAGRLSDDLAPDAPTTSDPEERLMAGLIAAPERTDAAGPRSPLVHDLMGVFLLLTLLFGGLSFFELP